MYRILGTVKSWPVAKSWRGAPEVPRSLHIGGLPVQITNGTKTSTVFAVSAVRHYPDLGAYLETKEWERVAPHTGSAVGALRAYRAIAMKNAVQVFSDERNAARGGICALELAPLCPSDSA